MVNWNEIDTGSCQCGATELTRFYETERNDPSDVELAHYECNNCGKHGRVFVENGYVTRTGGLR